MLAVGYGSPSGPQARANYGDDDSLNYKYGVLMHFKTQESLLGNAVQNTDFILFEIMNS